VTEAQLQKRMRETLIKEGALCWRNHGGPHSIRGIPDIVGLHHGQFFAIEVKLPGKEKTLTDLQKKKLRDIRAHGGIAVMVTTIDKARKVLRACEKKAKSRA
jgi:Holliday junction resolvase